MLAMSSAAQFQVARLRQIGVNSRLDMVILTSTLPVQMCARAREQHPSMLVMVHQFISIKKI